MTSLWCLTRNFGTFWYVLVLFGMYGERRPTAIPWYQINITRAFILDFISFFFSIFYIHRGVVTTTLVRRITKIACLDLFKMKLIYTYNNHNHFLGKNEKENWTVSKYWPKNEFSFRKDSHVTKILKTTFWKELLMKFGPVRRL